MAINCDLTINFASGGNSLAYLGGGWARSEAAFTWGTGVESHLVLPRLDFAGDMILTLDVVPFVHPPAVPRQRLTVSVNDTVMGSATLSRPTLLGTVFRPACAAGRTRAGHAAASRRRSSKGCQRGRR